MKSILLASALALPLALSACTPDQFVNTTTAACTDMAKLPVSVTAVLDAQPPHSALGVLWADAKAGCAIGAPTVSSHWQSMIWGEIKVLAPTVIPWLITLL